MSRDILIDKDGNTFREAGDVETVEGKRATKNRLRIILNWVFGEAEVALTEGISYFDAIRDKSPDLSLINSQIQDAVRDDPAVQRITEINTSYDGETRTLDYNFTAVVDPGEKITVKGSFTP